LNKKEDPIKVTSKGGFFAYDSTQETPNTQTCTFEYRDGKILEFETRGLITNKETASNKKDMGRDIGDIWYGTKGIMEMDAAGNWKTWMGRDYKPGPSSKQKEESHAMNLTGGGDSRHFENFISAVRSGNHEDLNCDIEVGVRSSLLPIMANVSYRVGRELKFDGLSNRFVADSEANSYLSRDYRAPFVVPDKV
jgi:hypothetical protein